MTLPGARSLLLSFGKWAASRVDKVSTVPLQSYLCTRCNDWAMVSSSTLPTASCVPCEIIFTNALIDLPSHASSLRHFSSYLPANFSRSRHTVDAALSMSMGTSSSSPSALTKEMLQAAPIARVGPCSRVGAGEGAGDDDWHHREDYEHRHDYDTAAVLMMP
eukprot:scaffold118714_cov66-Phaeocystis_antarctica.AAC.3